MLQLAPSVYAVLDAALDGAADSAAQAEAMAWLVERAAAIAAGDARAAATAIALAPRRVGKATARIEPSLLAPLVAAVPGLDSSRWSVDQWARLYLLLHLPAPDGPSLVSALDALFRSADVAEAVAMYQALPCLSFPEAHMKRAREGLRSNQKPLCAAVALDNPYPATYFAEDAWNQMMLKCLFVALPLHRVQGVDRRCNMTLSEMLIDYARERRSAARPIPYELWRVAAPCANLARLPDIERTLRENLDEDARAQPAAALGLAANPLPQAAQLLATFPQWAAPIAAGSLTWASLAEQRVDA